MSDIDEDVNVDKTSVNREENPSKTSSVFIKYAFYALFTIGLGWFLIRYILPAIGIT